MTEMHTTNYEGGALQHLRERGEACRTHPEIAQAMKRDREQAALKLAIIGPTMDTLKPGETPVNPRKDGMWQAVLRWAREGLGRDRLRR